MKQLVLEPTPEAQWQSLIQEAQASCARRLDEMLESYLIFLLMRFMDKPELGARLMAQEYLRSKEVTGTQRVEQLRDVGDQCLIFAGLFPQLAERRLVRISYFVNLGVTSYRQLSDILDSGRARMYDRLSNAFVVLMDILQAMREMGGETVLTPIQAVDLWQDTGSLRAYRAIRANSKAGSIPARGPERRH
jgi:hypothetical protein